MTIREKKFLKELKKRAYVLDIIRTSDDKMMVYYRFFDALVTDIRTIVF